MTDTDETAFTWQGKQTINAILPRLVAPTRLEIALPEDYNHALFVRLNPDAGTAQPEKLNIEGDVMLLREISSLNGLEELAALIEPLSRLAARVAVLSPPRIVIVLD